MQENYEKMGRFLSKIAKKIQANYDKYEKDTS